MYSLDAQFMLESANRAQGVANGLLQKADHARNAEMAAWYRKHAQWWLEAAERRRMEANAIEAEYREERARLVAATGAV